MVEMRSCINVAYDVLIYLLFSLFDILLMNKRQVIFSSREQQPTEHYMEALESIQNTSINLISVVIPCFNEVTNICDCLASTLTEKNVEVIIVDGGSTDGTINALLPYLDDGRVRIVKGGHNRSSCLNIGAMYAKGDVVLCLHADSILEKGYGEYVRQCFNSGNGDSQVLIGAFSFRVLQESGDRNCSGLHKYSLLEWGTNVRSHYFSLPYGDQALFFRKEVFQSVFGGFPCLPFMEDYELVCQAQSMIKAYASGPHKYPTSSTSWRICTVNGVVYSSLRRWEINGLVGNTVINQIIIFGRKIGVPHATLGLWYYGLSGKKTY